MPHSSPSGLLENSPLTPRSTEADDILSQQPSGLVQWSSAVFMGVLLLLFLVAWLIRYPDVVAAPFKLTTVNRPKPVYAKGAGKIMHLLARENQPVAARQILGSLESQADLAQVQQLARHLRQLDSLLKSAAVARWPAVAPDGGLGELQAHYQEFALAYTRFLAYQSSGYYPQKLRIQESELGQLQALARNIELRHRNVVQDFALATIEFRSQQQLFAQKVISANDFHREESKLLARKMPVQQIEADLITNQAGQSAKQNEILELRNSIAEQKTLLLEAVRSVQTAVQAWDLRYVLRAPAAGTVVFPAFLEEGQLVAAGQEVLYVTQSRGREYGEVYVQQDKFGKIRKGQRARIKFAGYPDDEFGIVEGKVDFISEIPTKEGRFLIRVALPNGLVTNYKKQLAYKLGMQATAEIITENTRLLDRLFYRLRRNFRQ